MTTIPQHLTALEHANAMRAAQCECRNQLKRLSKPEGLNRLAELIDRDNDELGVAVGSVRVMPLLLAVKGIGPMEAKKLLAPTGAGERKRVREITWRQRHVLAEHCRYRSRTGKLMRWAA